MNSAVTRPASRCQARKLRMVLPTSTYCWKFSSRRRSSKTSFNSSSKPRGSMQMCSSCSPRRSMCLRLTSARGAMSSQASAWEGTYIFAPISGSLPSVSR